MPDRIRAWKSANWHQWADRLLKRLHTTTLVSAELQKNPLSGPFEVFSLGKAAFEMAQGVLHAGLAPEKVLVVTTDSLSPDAPPPNWQVIGSQHPVPGSGSFHAGRELLARTGDPSGPGQILILLSGGTSSLLAAPVSGIRCVEGTASPLDSPIAEVSATSPAGLSEQDKIDLHRYLVNAGLSIMDVNLIRRHCSGVKGGAALKLALQVGKRVKVLAVSDVYSDEPCDVGSGPFAPDPTSFAQALMVAQKNADFPEAAMAYLIAGAQGRWGENLREEEIPADRWLFSFLARPGDALNLACSDLVETGGVAVPCPLWIDSTWLGVDGPFLRWLKNEKIAPGTWVVAVGEAEVRIPSEARPGKGGRASNLLLHLAGQLRFHWREFELGVLATDGSDGNSDLGGGFLGSREIEPFTVAHLTGTIKAFDTANFLFNIGNSLPGGRTGTNFGDILIFRWLS